MLLGLGDWQVFAALAACVGITLIGVVYGAVNWNNGSDHDLEPRRRHKRRR